MRKRVLCGSYENLPAHEILEVLLYGSIKRQDTNVLAHALISHFGSLNGVLQASVAELTKIKGVGLQTAYHIKACGVAMQYCKTERASEKKKLITRKDVIKYVKTLLNGSLREELVVICFDNLKNVLATRTWHGTVNRISVHPREIVEFCMESQATGVVMAHSHPNGSSAPSNNDISFTKCVNDALRAIDVMLMDHFIIANENDVYSFSQMFGAED